MQNHLAYSWTIGAVESHKSTHQKFLDLAYAQLVAGLIRTLGQPNPTTEQREVLAEWAETAASLRASLLTINMPLVAWVARRFFPKALDRDELISAGMTTLLRAVDTFNVAYGIHFSTYAVVCIRRAMSRHLSEDAKRQRRAGISFEPAHEPLCRMRELEQRHVTQELAHDVREIVLNNRDGLLTQRERYVLIERYGLERARGMGSVGAAVSDRPPLHALGEALGIGKERVRQIEVQALAKVRQALEARLSGTLVAWG